MKNAKKTVKIIKNRVKKLKNKKKNGIINISEIT